MGQKIWFARHCGQPKHSIHMLYKREYLSLSYTQIPFQVCSLLSLFFKTLLQCCRSAAADWTLFGQPNFKHCQRIRCGALSFLRLYFFYLIDGFNHILFNWQRKVLRASKWATMEYKVFVEAFMSQYRWWFMVKGNVLEWIIRLDYPALLVQRFSMCVSLCLWATKA